MQQAIVISSHYAATSGYPNLASWTPSAELLAARVAQYGYPIERLLPGPGLVRRLRELLRQQDPHKSAILYFAGYALVTENGDPALLMADEHVTALRLSQLTSRVSSAFGRALLVLDTTLGSAASDVEDTRAALGAPRLETPEATMAELMVSTCEAGNVSVLAGVRPWGASGRSASAFASLVEAGLKDLASAHAPTTASSLFEWLHERDESPGLAIAFVPAEPDFVVVPRRQFPSNPAALSPSPMVRLGAIPPLPPPPVIPAASIPPRPSLDWAHSPTLAPSADGFAMPIGANLQHAAPAPARPRPSAPPPPLPVERASQLPPEARPPTPPPLPAERASLLPPAPNPPPVEATAAPTPAFEPVPSPLPLEPAAPEPEPAAEAFVPPPEPVAESVPEAAPLPQSAESPLEPDHPSDQAPPSEALPTEPIPSQPPTPRAEVAGPESWRPPDSSAPRTEAVDEAALVASAEAAVQRGEAQAALDTARQCLALFPNSIEALQVAATLLARLEQWEELAALYEQLIAGHPDPRAVSKLCVAASRLYAVKLNSPARAGRALERACELQPKRSELQLEAAAFYETQERVDEAELHYKNALRIDPLNPYCYRRAAAFFAWIREKDLAWNAASIASFWGELDESEREILSLDTSEGLPRPSSALVHQHYSSGLTASASDPQLGQLFTYIADFARPFELPKPKQQQQLLRELSAEPPASSTTTLARAFGWVCQLLSVPVPELYLAESSELPSLLPVQQAAWRVGKGVGRGRSPRELLFIWARALARLQPDARATLYFGDQAGLLDLVYACLFATSRIGKPNERAHRLGKALQQKLDTGALSALSERLEGFDPGTAPARVAAWTAQLELIGNRVGLLACGDPRIAAVTLQSFAVGATPERDQLADLFSYAMSNSYAELRRQLGLSLG